jgi:LuxR family maltose regulon positive regulatory protein
MVGSRYLVYSGSGAAADEPLRMLEERLRTTGREARLAEAIAIRAILWKRMADTDGALAIMREALAIGERTGLQRTFLDLGDEAIALIEGIAGQPEHQRYAGLLLEAIENAEGSTAVERGGTASGEPALLSSPAASAIPVTFPSTPALAPSMGDQPRLSAREAEVLNLIAQGKSNKEIGAEIFVSLATVKWHSARIYEKLQVRNRTEAVARARQLGILR